MTTIRDELSSVIRQWTADGDHIPDHLCIALGIDPDLPAEWATVDRCLDWLREHTGFADFVYGPHENGDAYVFASWETAGGSANAHWRVETRGPTLHAALVAACRAVQDGEL